MFPHRSERQRITRHPKPTLGRFLREIWFFHEERWNIETSGCRSHSRTTEAEIDQVLEQVAQDRPRELVRTP